MSSPEYAELRGISGTAVAAKAATLTSQAKRDFIWTLQGLSLAEGGLKKVARDLLAMFPERIGTDTMHELGIKPGKLYSPEQSSTIKRELAKHFYLPLIDPDEPRDTPEAEKPTRAETFLAQCRKLALADDDGEADPWQPCLERVIVDLCVNPRTRIPLPGDAAELADIEHDLANEKFPEKDYNDHPSPYVPNFPHAHYFRDVVGALLDYIEKCKALASDSFCQTAISREVWRALDFGIKARRMVLLNGLEGRGKTEAAKAWCQINSGRARFVTLKGVTSKTTAFRAIAKALGVTSGYGRTATELQQRIEGVLESSKLMLALDEAHFAFNQSLRVYSRPELIDWIDTALCNHRVPVALVTTPQFLQCIERAISQVGWNYRQFRRRVARWVDLPHDNTGADIETVARRLFPKADKNAIDFILGYVDLSKRDLSALGDVADELRAIICPDEPNTVDLAASAISFKQVKQVCDELIKSDAAFARGLQDAAKLNRLGRSRRRPVMPALELVIGDVEGQGTAPGESRACNDAAPKLPASRMVLHDPIEADA